MSQEKHAWEATVEFARTGFEAAAFEPLEDRIQTIGCRWVVMTPATHIIDEGPCVLEEATLLEHSSNDALTMQRPIADAERYAAPFFKAVREREGHFLASFWCEGNLPEVGGKIQLEKHAPSTHRAHYLFQQ